MGEGSKGIDKKDKKRTFDKMKQSQSRAGSTGREQEFNGKKRENKGFQKKSKQDRFNGRDGNANKIDKSREGINSKKSAIANSKFEVVKQDEPQKYTKKNFNKPTGAPGTMNRRQKQKVSDLIKKLRVNYNKLIIKNRDKRMEKGEKCELVKECIELIGLKFEELLYKHDGCRILQALLKYGNKEQKTKVVESIKPHYLHVMSQKYSHYLASKAYLHAPMPEQKQYFRTTVTTEINKYIIHAYASEVIEYIYGLSTDQEKREMVFSFYGNYFLLLKEVEEDGINTKNITLKEFLDKKPQLADQILHKLEKVSQKVVEKGLTRHTIVQAILYDFFKTAKDVERLKNIADSLKEALPTLLASYKGLYVACACFNLLDAKDRKTVIKSLKDVLNEMLTNKISHLFVIHILNNLDDTQLAKKKIITEILKNIDEFISDKYYQQVIIGVLQPRSKRYFIAEELEAFEALKEHTSSKKPEEVRRAELLKCLLKPLEAFFEENLSYYLLEINKNQVLKCVLQCIIEVGCGVEHQDLIDEMFRQAIKKEAYEKEGGEKGILLGHQDLHRVLKELVKQEREQEDTKETLTFSNTIGSVLLKNFDDVIRSRAVFILLELIEHEETKAIVLSQVQKNKKTIEKIRKELPKAKGIEILLKKL
ncbi:pumilio domain-containing protein kiaa0020 homolog [Stylonychia lemnae]|uniref:Pumilio domain-containing protein kiaa0020 homolog n=1 Tax=Stylonychia lemnae TaxID=5949 RepID=A0A078A7V5_STYLE|nr:pumilio domain-containing protein kiaa0020 homolog [Stylonychia lemnae]|eukprot:CDW78334.1 pumilio domain-containing protein kiaa0020 homolog [Stylonychia lemnae]